MLNTKIVKVALFRILISIAIFASLCSAVSAGPLVNAGVYVGPATVSIGQSVGLNNAINATAVVSNVTVTLEVHQVINATTVGSTVYFSKVLTAQNFALNETKSYAQTYVIPSNLVTGTYTFVIKATSSDGVTSYLNLQSTSSPYIFNVNGVAAASYPRGINIMDLGMAGSVLPGAYGTNYTAPTLRTLQDLKARGLKVVRIPFLWERIQPTLGGSLNTAYSGYLLQVLRDANTAGLKVIVDMHNYGRYTPSGGSAHAFGDPLAPTQAQYTDAWKKISAAIKADTAAYSATYAYDLMNEPYSLVPNPGTLTSPSTISGFETNTEGWTTNWPSTQVLSQATRNSQGSLKLTVVPTAGSGLVFQNSLSSSQKQLSVTAGSTIQVKGFVPTATSGTVKVRIWIIDSSFTGHQSQIVTLTKGQDLVVKYTPDTAWWTNNHGIAVDFIVDNSDGVAPLVFYIDDVSQGTNVGAQTSPQIWEAYSQAAVTGIRSLSDAKLIMVEGCDFSSAENWPINHPAKWITDPQNNSMYQAHVYMDNGSGGTYTLSHSSELTAAQGQGYTTVGARAVARVKKFTDWTTAQNVSGYIGEFGWPNADTVGSSDAAAWNSDGTELLNFLDQRSMGGTMWATASWLSATGNINMAYQLYDPGSGRPFLALSQASILESHLGN